MILGYNGSNHQLKRWSREHLASKFAIVNRVAAMMKDVDGVSRYVDPFVYEYIITTSRLYTKRNYYTSICI